MPLAEGNLALHALSHHKKFSYISSVLPRWTVPSYVSNRFAVEAYPACDSVDLHVGQPRIVFVDLELGVAATSRLQPAHQVRASTL